MATRSFRARARTIDHLGREQIADCPTAVSELWKNAYDAYARRVGLHIFDGDMPAAAVVDDGHGMRQDEFESRWLTIGTESKADGSETPTEDRDGLPVRPKQGRKGIGRLSVAHLGPITAVVSKRRNEDFVTSLIDWRLFENPYLILEDIRIPVETFARTHDFPALLTSMFDQLIDNVWAVNGTPERNNRVTQGWARYDEDARKRGALSGQLPSETIVTSMVAASLSERHLSAWDVWTGARPSGTAMFVLGLDRELAVWVDNSIPPDDEEAEATRNKLLASLTAFIDPFTEHRETFDYEVVIHLGTNPSIKVSAERRFSLEDLSNLEHVVIGEISGDGLFRGRVRSFGRDFQDVAIAPARPPPLSGRGYVGPMKLCLGTFEIEMAASTHGENEHQRLREMAGRFGGLGMYRDGIRVLPYGRPDSDFLEMEERRGKHAGREFWAHRRTFGRVALTAAKNPNIRDKAGREGIIDNQAARELKLLLIALLKETARRYFGTESPERKEIVDELKARSNRAAEEAKRARRTTQKAIRNALKEQEPQLMAALVRTAELETAIRQAADAGDASRLHDLAERVEAARDETRQLRLPPRPRSLKRLEAQYRAYRDRLGELAASVESVEILYRQLLVEFGPTDPGAMAQRAFKRHEAQLASALNGWRSEICGLLEAESMRIRKLVDADRSRFHEAAAKLVTATDAGEIDYRDAREMLEVERDHLYAHFERTYEPYRKAMTDLAEGIEVASALDWSIDEREALLKRVGDLNALAQTGITVEILGHELHDIDAEVSRNLARLPQSCRTTNAYRLARDAHRSLTMRLRFLRPLQVAGHRSREHVRGDEIATFLEEFFRSRLEHERVLFTATSAFRATVVREHRWRLYPVFVNLVNNSLYWIRFGDVDPNEREIRLDRVGDTVIVADNGPGVDADDIPDLFNLFFTRRANGRGVGLYLAKANLASGYHTIRYCVDASERVLPGANFGIDFRGIDND